MRFKRAIWGEWSGIRVLQVEGKRQRLSRQGPFSIFLPALKAVHIGRGSPHIGDDPLKCRVVCHRFHFPHNGFLASPPNRSALVDGNGAKITFAITPPVGGNGKADGIKGLYLAHFCVIGVKISFVFKVVDAVHFRCVRHRGRGILDQVAGILFLGQALGRDGIIVGVKVVKL